MKNDFTSIAILNCHSFYNTGLILYELFEKYITDLEIIAMKYAIPMCTNFCLSIELSFKIIMNRFEEVYERKHNLLLLFNNLSDILKEIIIEAMKSTGYDEKDFYENLEKVKNGFIEYRYIGLDEKYDFSFLNDFLLKLATICHNLVIKMSPNTEKWLYDSGILNK